MFVEERGDQRRVCAIASKLRGVTPCTDISHSIVSARVHAVAQSSNINCIQRMLPRTQLFQSTYSPYNAGSKHKTGASTQKSSPLANARAPTEADVAYLICTDVGSQSNSVHQVPLDDPHILHAQCIPNVTVSGQEQHSLTNFIRNQGRYWAWDLSCT